ncbi:MAG TPA: AmmeMemoRadiSam system protein A, partial [Spirochaetota bacterium]
MDLQIDDSVKENLLYIVRSIIAQKLGVTLEKKAVYTDSILDEKYGAFVTLHINGNLRGCIGYIVGYGPLREILCDLALSSAFKDPRFPPLSVQEYSRIDIEISILSPIEKVVSLDDIVIGKHGLIIRKGHKTG